MYLILIFLTRGGSRCTQSARTAALNSACPSFGRDAVRPLRRDLRDRKSTRLNSSHSQISYAVFCLKKKNHGQRAPAAVADRTRVGARALGADAQRAAAIELRQLAAARPHGDDVDSRYTQLTHFAGR